MADYTLVIKAVDQTGSTLRNIEGNLGGLSGAAGVATRALGLAAAAAAAVGAAVAAVAVSSVKSATEIQNLGIQLKALTGSSEGGAAALQAIRDAALKLPFDLQEIAKASPALVTVSKDSNQLAQNIQLAADLAATTGLSFQDTSTQLQRAFSAGAGAADLFRERGVLALAGFRAGATYSADETIKKFRELGEKIKGTSEELNKTLPGAISQLKDQYYKLQVAFGTPIGESLAAALNVLVGDLNNSSDSMVAAAKAAGQDFALGLANAIDYTAKFIDYISGIVRIFQPTIDIIIFAAKIVGDLLVRAFGVAGMAIAAFGVALGTLTDAIGLTDGLAAASDRLGQAYATLTVKGIAGFGEAADKALASTTNGTTRAQDAASRFTDAIRKNIQEQRNATETSDKFGNTAFSNYHKAQTAAEQYLEKLQKGVKEAKDNLAILLTAFSKTADYATRIKFAAEIDSLRKSLGEASPVMLTFTESMKQFKAGIDTTASAQARATQIADEYAQGILSGAGDMIAYKTASAAVNQELKNGNLLRADAIVALAEETKQLENATIKLDVVSQAYYRGAASIEQYLAVLGNIPASQKTATQYLDESAARYKQQEIVIGQQVIALEDLRKKYADGSISLQEYTARTSDLGNAIDRVGRSTADVIGEATKQSKEYRNNISLQGQLNDLYKSGAISADIYSAAAKNLGIPDDQIQRSINAFGTVEAKAQQFRDNFSKYSEEAATAFSDSFVTAVMKGENILNSFKDFFKNILNYIAQQILKSAIADPLANALGGLAKNIGGSIFGSVGAGAGAASSGSLFGSLGASIGKFFGGFFADGGSIPGGKASVVGERGPELFIPKSSGTIIPNEALGSGDTFHVNFNISAIDTQSGAEFIMRNKPIITGVIEQAYNKRGRRGPVTVG